MTIDRNDKKSYNEFNARVRVELQDEMNKGRIPKLPPGTFVAVKVGPKQHHFARVMSHVEGNRNAKKIEVCFPKRVKNSKTKYKDEYEETKSTRLDEDVVTWPVNFKYYPSKDYFEIIDIEDDTFCSLCGSFDYDMVFCDGCEKAFHPACLHLSSLPTTEHFFCEKCTRHH